DARSEKPEDPPIESMETMDETKAQSH
ncbi:hypothetical protein B0I26_1381, partial [Anoxybacillus vitaminiphilus]